MSHLRFIQLAALPGFKDIGLQESDAVAVLWKVAQAQSVVVRRLAEMVPGDALTRHTFSSTAPARKVSKVELL